MEERTTIVYAMGGTVIVQPSWDANSCGFEGALIERALRQVFPGAAISWQSAGHELPACHAATESYGDLAKFIDEVCNALPGMLNSAVIHA